MRTEALASIYSALDAINAELPRNEHLKKEPATILVGPTGGLDSLALLNFVSLVEQELEQRIGVTLSLYEDSLLTGQDDPFHSVDRLTRHIDALLTRRAA